MLELLVKNATLPNGRQGMNIAVQNGRIVEVSTGLDAHDMYPSYPRC